MYTVCKTLEVSASHSLRLDYSSPCQEPHGHNWKIKVWCRGDVLNSNGMLIDFSQIKEIVHGTMDHKNLDDVFDFNPTAENIAEWIVKNVPTCYMAEVWESEKNYACFDLRR